MVAGSSFNPFATTFSRKARTRLQERAERGLAHLSESQARWQQRFSKLEERNITIMLPQARSQQPQGASTLSFGDSIETKEDEEDEERREVELVAQLWREKMSKDQGMRFETSAARKLRLLRTAKVYPYVLLRIRLPGGMFIQARFSAEESLEVRGWNKFVLFLRHSIDLRKRVCMACQHEVISHCFHTSYQTT